MKAIPTDWLEKTEVEGTKYWVDMNYRIWNMDTEEIIYAEDHAEEMDLTDVIEGNKKWDNSDDPFTLQDFLAEVLEIF